MLSCVLLKNVDNDAPKSTNPHHSQIASKMLYVDDDMTCYPHTKYLFENDPFPNSISILFHHTSPLPFLMYKTTTTKNNKKTTKKTIFHSFIQFSKRDRYSVDNQ